MVVRLTTDVAGVELRCWLPDDVPTLVLHADDRGIWRNLTEGFPSPYTEADAHNWVATANEPSRGTHLAITFDGTAIGGIGLIAGVDVAWLTAQFGYWLGRRYWGRGIATAAARAMLVFAREQAGFARLEAPVFAWNPASMRVLEKVGFERQSLRRRSVFKDGKLIDSVLYVCLIDRPDRPAA
jgi:ribosomal-protein-alanine N-acetyltransferase